MAAPVFIHLPDQAQAIDAPLPLDALAERAIERAVAWYGRPLLSLSEFASLTGKHIDTVREWARAGLIPVKRIGNSPPMIPTQQFLKWLEETTQYPKAPGARRSLRERR